MQIEKNKVVTIDFTVRNCMGQALDTSRGATPLVYLQGSGMLVKGLEAALEGKEAGENIAVTLEAKDAYGERREELVQAMPRHQFEAFANPLPGMQFEARGAKGEAVLVSVMEVRNDSIIVDLNHPLAGLRLGFEVSILDVREASEQELVEGRPLANKAREAT